jgi:pseudouridine synthase
MRLQKYLAQCGVASRRQAEKLIEAGRVQVNGEIAALGSSVEPEQDEVLFDGENVATDSSVYLLMNKPLDVVTSVTDDRDRKTVIDCIQGIDARVFPVGRLDLDVEGALLLTNDGELAYRMTHPKFQIDKVYLVWVRGSITPELLQRLEKGVELEDGMARAAKAELVRRGKSGTLIHLVMREGRKREVKRLCKKVGHPVQSLKRISIANLRVKGLKPGEWRHLRDDELRDLRKLTGLTP